MKKVFLALIMFPFILISCKKEEKNMIYKTDFYSIEYDKQSEKLVQKINDTLSQNFQHILYFWEIEKLNNHVNIKIFSELDEWIKFYEEKSGTKYQDYVIGCADGPNIYVLAFDEYKKNTAA